MTTLPALDSIATTDLGKFNGYMSSRSYIEGFSLSSEDSKVFAAFKEAPDAKKAGHVARWYSHVASFSDSDRKSWPAPSAPVEIAPVAEAEEEDPFADDDDDLFADDGGDAAAALQEKLKQEAVARGKEKLKNARSMIVFEVKPYEADFDLEAVAQAIKALKHEGIQNWGAEHKLQPVAYGIKKLIISVVVYDELCGMDDISDMIMEQFEDDVQSIDVQAMSKV